MRFNGWVRLWIVGAVIYGGVVANYAYREWPMLEQLQYNWIRDASEKMATAITANEVVSISLEKLSAHWFDDRTYTDAILELEQIEKSPTINQRIFSAKI